MAGRRVVVVGGGFGGFHAAREFMKAVPREANVELILINPTDYFLYVPLLPEVAAGILDPRAITISLPRTLPGVRLLLGQVTEIDPTGQSLTYADPEGHSGTLAFDQLILAAGSVHKLLPVPGVADHGHGFRGLPEALYLRDHITRQLELAAATDAPAERSARCTFVVVGAGYTGTEVAAHGQLLADLLARRHPELADQPVRWILLEATDRVLPGLDRRLSRTADRVLRERGVEVCTETSIRESTQNGVRLDDGRFVPTRSLVWCVGVRPDPLVAATGLDTVDDRLAVDDFLAVPSHPWIFACGDAAAVPRHRSGGLAPMTAQHAVRQGKVAGRNVAAALGFGRAARYRHRERGFVVDLGGRKAAANPLHLPLSGLPAKAVTRGYHLLAMPTNRLRVAVDWLLDTVMRRQQVQLGLVRSGAVPLDTASPEVPDLGVAYTGPESAGRAQPATPDTHQANAQERKARHGSE
ncbi:NAD(P)/FAD-dependent oxidoreductase [Tamaricihabitans halophyticus]|nr:FAD-dependent oxidoreductase [Tamaricihabitans halophyticus]